MALRSVIPAFQNFMKLGPSIDKVQLETLDAVQMVLRVSKPSFVQHLVKKFTTEMIAFNLKSDGRYLIPTSAQNVVHRIPSNLRDLQATNDWMVNEHPPLITDRLGCIAANDDTVAINMVHLCGDGKYLVGAVNHIFDPIKKLKSPLPTLVDRVFEDDLSKDWRPINLFTDDRLMRFMPTSEKTKLEIPVLKRADIKEFTCYDKMTGKCKGLTEAMWSSIVLSMWSLYGGSNHMALDTCVDLRPFMNDSWKRKMDLSFANFFTVMSVGIDPKVDWLSRTLGDCCRLLREDLQRRVGNPKALLAFLKMHTTAPVESPIRKDQPIINSHVGVIKIREPVSDILVTNNRYYETFPDSQLFLTYAIVDKEKDRNELVMRLRVGANGVTREDANIILDTFVHSLRTFTPDMPMRTVIKEIKDFQKDYSRKK